MGGAQASGAATALLGPASLSLEKDPCGLENRTTRKETAAGMRLVLHVLEKLQTGFKYFHGGGGRHCWCDAHSTCEQTGVPSLSPTSQSPLIRVEPDRETAGQAEMWFADAYFQHHKAQHRKMGLELRD